MNAQTAGSTTTEVFDFIWIFLLYAAVVYRNAMYPVQMYEFYQGKTLPGVFDHFYVVARVYLTRMGNGHHPFALWRNLVFNIIREGFCFTYGRVFFDWGNCGHHTVVTFLRYHALWAVVYTVIL